MQPTAKLVIRLTQSIALAQEQTAPAWFFDGRKTMLGGNYAGVVSVTSDMLDSCNLHDLLGSLDCVTKPSDCLLVPPWLLKVPQAHLPGV